MSVGAPNPQDCVRTRSIRALLLVLAPATVASAPLATVTEATQYPWVAIGLVAGMLVVAGLGHRQGGVWMRALATLAFGAWAVGTIAEDQASAAQGFFVLLGAVAFVAFLWPSERLRQFAAEERTLHPDQEFLIAGGVAAFFGLNDWQMNASPSVVESLSLTIAYLVPIGLALRRLGTRYPWDRRILAVAAAAALVPAGAALGSSLGYTLPVTPLGLLSPLTMFGVVARRAALRWLAPVATPTEPGLMDAVLAHPSRVLVLSFVGICGVGTLLLGLPVASASGQALSWLDAAFTAVSAACVTGLIVVDTPNAFGGFGQMVVLALIQVGGLGIMVFSAAALVLLGKRLSLSYERAAVDIVGASGRGGLVRAIRGVLIVTFATEASAAVLLSFGFLARGDGVAMAAWRGTFTAISAFCNAGFALQSESLIPYADSPYLLTVIGLTIVIGGLGPAVVAAVVGWRDPTQRSLYARIVLWTSAILVLGPAILITALEWNGTLGGMSLLDKVVNGAFQSITLRTAGFNSIDLTHIHPATWTVMILLMYVGGSPGSTAGGVKTTTIAVVVLAIVAVVRGRGRVEVFGRELPMVTVLRATAVATLGVLAGFLALAAIQITQAIPLDVALFEVVSALATVGLSTGGTGVLDEVGKVLIMASMFAGRVGPLTLFVFLASNTPAHMTRRYPVEPVPIG